MQLPALALLQAPPEASARPRLHGRFEVLEPLGSGGFGTVVRARDVHIGKAVALKELTRRGGRSLERFKQEFRALQEVHHPNVGSLELLFEHEGSWYIAMELVEGRDLLSYVRPNDQCDPERLRAAFLGLVDGLCALHAAGFVHRDVTPDNVRVSDDGRAVLLDFGLLARTGDERERSPMGKPEYAAPEQIAGAIPEPSADIFSVACCLYQAVAGVLPFHSVAREQLLFGERSAPPPLRSERLPGLGGLAMRMLSANPAARPDLRELRAVLAPSETSAELGHDLRGRLSLAQPEQPGQEVLFAGRSRELSELSERFSEASASGLRITLVEGESGLGKSALVAEFALRAHAKGDRL